MKQSSFVRMIKGMVTDAGSYRAFAETYGVELSTISLVLAGKQDPPPKLLTALGYERVTTYKRRTD